MTLFDFSDPDSIAAFAAIDDVVMGGCSASRMVTSDHGTGLFTGTVSLENNGGFASVRSRPFDWDLSRSDGLVLEVRGDGRRYKVNLKTDAETDQTAYQAYLETRDGEWQTVELPFRLFEPKLRGRRRLDAGPIDLSRVRTLGLMIADRKAGPFRLELRTIRTI